MTNKDTLEAIYLLSPVQKGMLFHSLHTPRAGMYIEQLCLTFVGEIDLSAFKQTWMRVIERHAAFRTLFVWAQGDQPRQIVHKPIELPWLLYDWRGFSAIDQQKQLQSFLQTDRERGFDVSKAPLMRLTMIRLTNETYQFVWSHHHLLLDGWSVSLVLKEIFELYSALYQGKNTFLEPSRPYSEYISWLRLQDNTKAEAFWHERLKDLPHPTSLGVDVASDPANIEDSSDYAEQGLTLSEEETSRLQSFARQHDLTMHTLLQGAWALLLNHYSNEHDIVFGSVVSGRPTDLRAVESMVGLFINTLPVRVSLTGEDTLVPWLQRLQTQHIEMQEYGYCGLVDIQRWSEIPGNVPLFKSIVVFENYPLDEQAFKALGNARVEHVHLYERTNYTLVLMSTPARKLPLRLGYSRHHFSDDTTSRMLGHLRTIFTQMAFNSAPAMMGMLTEAEKEKLIFTANATQRTYPEYSSLHGLIEEQVKRTPLATALAFEGRELTYEGLNRKANQVAHYLQRMEVGPDVLVGICMERSLEMVIGLLGILKAGGAYVPLDPSYPADHLAFMLDNAHVNILLSQQHLLSRLPQHHAQVICLDHEWERLAGMSEQNPPQQVHETNLAYMIYTSGSTGRPKGAMNTHLGICNRLLWMQDTYPLDTSDRVLQKTPFSFDVSVWEFFWPLLAGARLVVARPGGHQDSAYLVQLIEQQKVTTIHFVPSMLQVFLDNLGPERCASLRRVICSGEALSFELQRRFFERLDVPLHNLYGPTEAAVDVTFWACQRTSAFLVVPIGQPIANTQIYLLDRWLQQVPLRVPGELCIGGVGLARGYYQRPDLTAEKFLPHPFSEQPGARLYRTGDLARYVLDGEQVVIEYLGRTDNQIKLRGFRIELGEVEAALREHEAIREAVVIVQERSSFDKRLFAYIVLESEADPTLLSNHRLNQFLLQKLPPYMVPAAFVVLTSLPLTPNGKADRRALLALSGESVGDRHASYIAPRTEMEALLAGIWQELLGVAWVGIHDNFFELGGHSLLATQLIARVRKIFRVELPIRACFAAPDLALMSNEIEKALNEEHYHDATPLPPISHDASAERSVSFAQKRLWFLDRLAPGKSTYTIATALHMQGNLNITTMEQSLQALVARQEILRASFPIVNGQPELHIVASLQLDFPVHDLSHLSPELREGMVQQFIRLDAQQPFNLSSGPLLRTALLQLQEQEYVLLLSMHHIISDGWSLDIFLRELKSLYTAFLRGQASPLPELAVQYTDYVAWQLRWLHDEVLERQMAYWREQLAGVSPILDLPTDHPRPAEQSYRGTFLTHDLPPQLSTKLMALSQRAGVTLFMLLVAAFGVLLSHYSGQEDLLIGTPIAGRRHQESEALIGFFANTLVLRTDLRDNPRFREVLRLVREMTLGAYSHQDVPFEYLVEMLQPERDLSRSPLFQALFALQRRNNEIKALEDVQLHVLDVDTQTAKFDLTLMIEEKDHGLRSYLEYNTDLFEQGRMQRFLLHWQTLLEGIVADPEQRVRQLSFMTADERKHLIQDWNATTLPYQRNMCLHRLVEARVISSPEAVAVLFEETRLTYCELNAKANQLAHYLNLHGVGPDVLVGICMERSLEMVIGLLGILKAGGAYVPLDPAYPADRLAFMLDDAHIQILLSQQHLLRHLPIHNAQVICLDHEWEMFACMSEQNPPQQVHETNLAYMIYTSGSTGRPKGAMNTHLGICNRLLWMQDTYPLDTSDRVLQKTPFSFDVSVWEFFWPLLAGARLVVARPGGHQDSAYLVQLIEQQKVTTTHFIPSMFQLFLETPGLERCASLRRVICSGEALSFELQKRCFARLNPGLELYNLYGPTEASVEVMYQACQRDTALSVVPLGQPIRNMQIYLLDHWLQPVPLGIPGELYIGGIGLARGYYRRADLTAEKFFPHPFSEQPGARLYRTGDLARYVLDGEQVVVEYLGRGDDQVKMRGLRIELGEIEAALSQHEAIRETVAVIQERTAIDKRIIAYIVRQSWADQAPLSNDQLEQFLLQRLPSYMVPAAFVQLDAMPLNPSGKVDRRSLLKMANESTFASHEGYVAAQTETEELLVELWQELLGVAQVGIYDNFFALGGHSLLVTQFIIRLTNACGAEIPLRAVFETPTIAALARLLEETLLSEIEILQNENTDAINVGTRFIASTTTTVER